MWDEKLAQEVVKERLAFTHGKPVPCLVDGQMVTEMTSNARRYLSEEGESGVTALALLICSPVERIIANFYLMFSRPRMPTRLFTSKEAAIQWLRKQAPGDQQLPQQV